MKNPDQSGYLRRRKIFRSVFGVFSLSGILFAFQACYGSPQDFGQAVRIHGKVTAQHGQANLAMIRIDVNGADQYTWTDADGTYSLWCERMREYRLTFSDPNSPRASRHETRDTTVIAPEFTEPDTELTVNIDLK